jgi:hypothetical protein
MWFSISAALIEEATKTISITVFNRRNCFLFLNISDELLRGLFPSTQFDFAYTIRLVVNIVTLIYRVVEYPIRKPPTFLERCV